MMSGSLKPRLCTEKGSADEDDSTMRVGSLPLDGGFVGTPHHCG